ncbi:MAG: hypothetical protein ACM3S2_14700 [Ignavibacteriales bacterium]
MKYFLKNLYILLILTGFCINSHAQDKYSTVLVTDTIRVNFNNIYPLSSVSIVPFSELIKLNGRILNREDYTVFYPKAYFRLSDSLKYSIFDTLIVTYQSYKTSLKKEYKRRTLETRPGSGINDTIRVLKAESSGFTPEAIFGKDIHKSGTLVRGFTVGTTRDLTLNSGLRLQLSGRLSENIEIVAALTDENTPIQPEGNTERLDELDKVFIEIRHPNAIGTFGDYDLNGRLGEFGAIDRKLQGLKAELNFDKYKGILSIAGSKGKFNTNQFNGGEGVQGPYRLSGINSERDIIVIAGSEKVYIDGEVMKRGENNDYVIDYSNAQITFTPRRLITSASRISVDFEYSDRRFARTFFGTSFQTSQLNDKINIKINYFREGDNQDSPIDVSISDSDRKILEAAGNDRNAAVKSGVTLALPDSMGVIKGAYTRVDTLVGSVPYSYYVYNPGKGLYNVIFSFIGSNKGDYERESLGNYRFAGIGKGEYLPIVFLPMPELKQMGNIALEIFPAKDISLNLEAAGSLWDKNRFSNLDKDNSGTARNVFLNIKPQEVKIGDVDFGKIGLSFKDRYIQSRFTTLDRINEVEFNRNYNISATAENSDEQLREGNLTLVPWKLVTVNSMYGYLRRGSEFTSKRLLNSINIEEKNKYGVDYHFDYVNTLNSISKTNWYRQNGSLYYYLGDHIRTSADFLAEDKRERPGIFDSLGSGSLKYTEYIPSIDFVNLGGLNFRAQYSIRNDLSPINGIMERESKSYTQTYDLSYRGIKEFTTSLNLVLRSKKYTDAFLRRGLLNNETILVRSQSRFNLADQAVTGDLYYEGSTQRAARLQRVFIKVPVGTGNYKYSGDLNNNGIADENEFEPTLYDGDYVVTTYPTDQLFPVIDLKVNTRLHISMDKIVKKNTLAGFFLTPVSSETFIRVEENSKLQETKKIYLLHFSAFQNDSTTISGSNLFQQDLFLFENSNELSFRFRFMQTKSLNQFSGGPERGYVRERSLRIKFKMVEEVSNQTDIINQADNLISTNSLSRARMLTGNTFSTDFSYRPVKNIEAGLKLTTARLQDDLPVNPTVINQNSQNFRFTLSFAGTGRLRLEVERNELLANTELNYIPFEMTKGNFIGKNYFWRFNFDYRFAGNLQSTIGYDGRVQGKGGVIHTARAEVRAFF